jgi:glucokinase
VDERKLEKRFKWKKAHLINDLTATALAIPLLNRNETYTLNRARPRKGAPVALIAPGSGLGEALLVSVNDRYVPVSSEGGHVDFAPNNGFQTELWRYLHKIYGHVSIERVLTGPGLFNIYSWLKESGHYLEPAWLSKKLRETDPARVITSAALNRSQPMCKATLDLFVSILGAAAGNLALTGMTTGGVYLGGGIPPKILPGLKQDKFMKSFTDKGRFKELMEKMPVKVIVNDKAALLGAAAYAIEKG